MQFPFKPLSVNAKFDQHYKTGRIIKSKACKAFERRIEDRLGSYREKIEAFRKNYSRDKASLHFDMIIYVPEAEFFTKDGLVSLTCLDTGNAFKMLEDTIFKALGINDALNVKISGEKRPYKAEEWVTLVTINEIPVPRSCYLDSELRDTITLLN
jgi:hypothetical protein